MDSLSPPKKLKVKQIVYVVCYTRDSPPWIDSLWQKEEEANLRAQDCGEGHEVKPMEVYAYFLEGK